MEAYTTLYGKLTIICMTICIISTIVSIPSIKDYRKRVRIRAQGSPPISYIILLSSFGITCIMVGIITGVLGIVNFVLWLK